MTSNTKILVVDDMEEIREILLLMIESVFDYPIIEASSGNEAIEILKQNPDINIVISDYDMPDGNGSELYKEVRDNYDMAFILISSIALEDDESLSSLLEDKSSNKRITKPFDQSELIAILENISNEENTIPPTGNTPNEAKTNAHQRIKINRVKNFEVAFGDIYIKLSDIKYLKITNKDEEIDKDKIEYYTQKNIEYLYVDKDHYQDYLNSSVVALVSRLNAVSVDSSELIGLQLDSIEEVRELAKSIGVKQSIIDLTDKVSETVGKKLSNEKCLKSFLGDMLGKNNFFFEQSNITNYLTSAMIKELGWDMKSSVNKMIQASIFCDISLDDETLSIQTNIENEQFKELPLEKRQLVKAHMESAIKILSKAKTDFSEEEKIIATHHELPDGSGFPKGLTCSQISPTAATFILAHNFARELILEGKKENIDTIKILSKLGESYNTGNFQKPYQALEKCLQK